MFISDAPIIIPTDDSLDRKDFAKNLAKSILSWKNQEALVMGISGEWGSGKSSIINMTTWYIRNELSKNVKSKPIIVSFNPWQFSEQTNLITIFLLELGRKIGTSKIGEAERLEKLGNTIEAYGKSFDMLASVNQFLPYPGSGVVTGLLQHLARLKNLGKTTKEISQARKIDLESQKEEIVKQLSDLKQKVVVVIDDIDRLNPGEVRQMFRLVKSVADFPNIIYLLLFDSNAIAGYLDEKGDAIAGKKYIEKIVQVSFDIPKFEISEMHKEYLFPNLDKVLKLFPENIWENDRWNDVYHDVFKHLFSNLRSLKRYINSLTFYAEQVRNEVNPLDFMVVEAMRLFFPSVYQAMVGAEILFTESVSDLESTTKTVRERRILGIIESVPENSRGDVRRLLNRLFPQMEAIFGRGRSYLQDDFVAKRRICIDKRYKSYFLFRAPKVDISYADVESVLNVVSSKTKLEQAINKLVKKGKIRQFLERAPEYIGIVSEKNLPNFIIGILNTSYDFPRYRISDFDIGGVERSVRYLMYRELKRIKTQSTRATILKTIVSKVTHYDIITEFILNDVYKTKDGDEGSPEDPLLTEKEVIPLQKILITSLTKMLKSKNYSELRLSQLIGTLAKWTSEDNVKKLISLNSMTQQEALNFMVGYMWQATVKFNDNQFHPEEWNLNAEAMSKYIDPAKLLKKIIDKHKYADREKRAVEILKKYVEENKKPKKLEATVGENK